MKLYSILLITSLALLLNISQQQVPGKLSQTTYNIDSSIWDIKWCGKDLTDYERDNSQDVVPKYENKIVFILSHEGTLYRSADEGKTWSNLQNNLNKLSALPKQEKIFITKIVPSIGDSTTMYFMGSKGVSFYTNDCGKNFYVIRHDKDLADLKPSNTKKEWILGAVKKNCPSSVQKQNCPVLYDIYFSENFGLNWRLIEQWVLEYSWSHLSKSNYFVIPEKRIILSRYDIAKDIIKPWFKILNVNVPIKIVYSDDFFKTERIISPNGVRFYLTKPYLFIMENKDIIHGTEKLKKTNSTQEFEDNSYQLSFSYTYLTDYRLQPISIPIERIKDHSFTILDASEGIVYINVNHYGPQAFFGNIYVSDYTAYKYSLSLLHNVRSSDGYCDFDKMESTEGVFIANHYEHTEAERAKIIYEEEWNTDKQSRKSQLQKIEQYKKSVITYDKGATWSPLIAPTIDSQNQTIECSGECSLHLRGYTDQITSPIYSSKNAVGLIIGVGNTGMYLENSRTSQLNTYLSRDSGLTWQELIKGSHLYEIGDHGGLLVLADDQKPTTEILYSWDEGLTWEKYQISDTPIDVQNILIEPTNMASVFLIVGKKAGKKGQEGIIITLDFGSLHQRVCHGLYQPGSDKSDYEYWIPHWHKQDDNGCVMGKQIKYVRRKREAKCWNDEDFEKKIITKYCQCTELDWECDFGYVRENDSFECKPVNDEIVENNKKVPENCISYYFVSQGYRKIPGDFCQLGVDKSAIRMTCPQNKANQQQQNQFQVDMRKFIGNQNDNNQQHQKENDQEKNSISKFYIILVLVVLIILCFRTKIQELIGVLLDRLSLLKIFSNKRQNRQEYERVGGNLFGNNEYEDDDL